jgi:hypothetical protein
VLRYEILLKNFLRDKRALDGLACQVQNVIEIIDKAKKIPC